MVMVMLPLARRDGDGQGMVVLRAAAQRFLLVAWGSMVLLAITGVYLGLDHWNIGPGEFFGSGGHFLRTLQVKTGLFLFVTAVSLAHDFWLGPRLLDRLDAAREAGQPPPRGFSRIFVLMVARINLLAVLAIVALAVVLIRP